MKVIQHCQDSVVIDECGFTLTDDLMVMQTSGRVKNPGMRDEQRDKASIIHLCEPSAKLFQMMACMMEMKEVLTAYENPTKSKEIG